MYDIKSQIQTLLTGISGATVYYIHADQFSSLPVITFCEYNNSENQRQGTKEYLSKIVVQVDLYTSNGDDLSTLALAVNDQIYTSGFRRSNTRDTYDTQTNLFHKSMWFVGYVQPDTGVVYQYFKEDK